MLVLRNLTKGEEMMNRRKTAKLTILCMVLSCLLISGCAPKEKTVVIMEKGVRSSLRTPSNLTVKVVGETVYTYGDTTIPVGDIMKSSIENNLKNNKKFSLDKNLDPQYLIGVNIIKYEPRIDPAKKKLQLFQYPKLWCEAIICNIKTDNKGEKIIGNKLFSMPLQSARERSGGVSAQGISVIDIAHGIMTYKTAWRDAIEDVAKKISDSLDDIFSK